LDVRQVFAAIASLMVALACLTPAGAAPATPPPLEWELPNGRFFTQASGYPLGTAPDGFAIVDDGQARFWSEFRRLGGVERLGYPASRRFQWNGFVTQATQKALLQWRPEQQRAYLVNVVDELSVAGLDDWLAKKWSVPRPLPAGFDAGKPWSDVMSARLALLRARPALDRRYASAADPLSLYGLPMSAVTDMGSHYSIRLQRAVLQEWKVDMPWAKAGEVTVANGGDIFKDSGLGPKIATRAEMPAPQPWARAWTFEPSAYRIEGKTTWYGGDFHGNVMANGQIYDMWNPGTTASNAYPMGSRLRVTSTKTGKTVDVTVTDTGAFKYPYVVDVSLAAFRALGLRDEEYVGDVRVEWIGGP
jgi:hypothetical protein